METISNPNPSGKGRVTLNESKKIGVFGASSIVAGNMMGFDIALLPSSPAKSGKGSNGAQTEKLLKVRNTSSGG